MNLCLIIDAAIRQTKIDKLVREVIATPKLWASKPWIIGSFSQPDDEIRRAENLALLRRSTIHQKACAVVVLRRWRELHA